MKKSDRLRGEAQAALAKAKEIAERCQAEGRDFTDDEKAEYDRFFSQARTLNEQKNAALADERVLAEADALATELGMPQHVHDDLEAQARAGDTRARVRNLGLQVVESAAYKNMLAPFADGRIPEKSRIQSDPIAVNTLITGGSDTSGGAFVVAEQTGIVEMLGRRPLTFRDVISVRRTGSDTVEFVRQTSHTNNAAPVPEATSTAPIGDGTGGTTTAVLGGLKPEGAWAFERDTAVVKTIAEWVPATKRALADVAAMEGLIRDELQADLQEEEEDQIVSGNGTGENLEGILTVSGTQAQAFTTDIFVTVRKALTKARTVGRVAPNGVALNPTEVETVDLARDGNQQFYGAGPFAMGPRTLWGVPIIESEAVPAGTGIVGDFRKAVLWDREQATVTMTDSHADFFTRNLVAILGEERVAFAVTRPTAFVVTDVAA